MTTPHATPRFLTRMTASAIGGTLTSTAALMMLSAKRTGSPWPGLNCTAHWLKGDKAALVPTPDLVHTGTGFATSAGAIVFWAALYEAALGTGKLSFGRFLAATAALGPVAIVADYGATPKRFTPGWELLFSKRDMTLIYTALVLGMAAGSTAIRPFRTCACAPEKIATPSTP
ncbi:hypothetical protein [Acetobacter conturbans]|uniref:Uncharacterized protein n=1 Tax=Acetobacter conturbans TaxID=1737472 RepID=A0ABX0JUN5_9PROT|nr:hypothetical protein [Acetobacter conturbans]NHN87077.1 hypothetical protein [Acetobacter conturbans]